MAGTPHTTLPTIAKVVGLASLALILYADFGLPDVMEKSDYVATFYVAAHLSATGQMENLYPETGAESFIGARFDKAAHELLPHLPQEMTAAFMYAPIVAQLFSPIHALPPNLALLVWQAISLGAMIWSCYLLSRTHKTDFGQILQMSFLYLPLFISIWIGQAGIVFGLLPLCAGYFLAQRQRLFLSGMVWSLLVLKTPLLPIAGLIALALASTKKFRCLLGLMTGGVILTALTLLVTPFSVVQGWTRGLALADEIFSRGFYIVPFQLIVSLPLNALLLVPTESRAMYRLPIYGVAMLLALTSLWYCRRALLSTTDMKSALPLVVAMSLVVMPLVSPHMLYYDLAVLLPAGVILFEQTSEDHAMRRWLVLAWVATGAYMTPVLAGISFAGLPLVLQVFLFGAWLSLLRLLKTPPATAKMEPA